MKKIFLVESSILDYIEDLSVISDAICEKINDLYAESLIQFISHLETGYPNKINYVELFPTKEISLKDINLESNIKIPIKIVFQRFDLKNGKALYSNQKIYVNLLTILTQFAQTFSKTKGVVFSNKNKNEKLDLIIKFIQMVYGEVLHHEIQHAHHDYQSTNKYIQDKKSLKYYNELGNKNVDPNSEEILKKYYNLPHEYWAYFSQFLYSIRKKSFNNFNDLWRLFKLKFKGYDFLSKDDEKRILKALYKYFTNQKEKSEL